MSDICIEEPVCDELVDCAKSSGAVPALNVKSPLTSNIRNLFIFIAWMALIDRRGAKLFASMEKRN